MKTSTVAQTLKQSGFSVQCFDTAKAASDYLDRMINEKTVGFGGSMTLESMDLWNRLKEHNTVYSHLHGFPAGPEAATAQIYISSVNGLAETGELVLIDGDGNRVSAVLYGHETVYFVVGKNKIAPTYEEAVWRARNIAAPLNARRKQKHTPCAIRADHCYNCKSPDRICRAMVTIWQPLTSMNMEIVLVNEELGF